MANKWLLVSIMVLSSCGGGAMRENAEPGHMKSGLKGGRSLGTCKSNPTGFEVELGYRNIISKSIGYPDHPVAFNFVGSNQFVVSEVISLKEIESIDPQFEPVFIFPDRCFESGLKSVSYQHIEVRPDQEQMIVDMKTFEADRKNQMQFSLLDTQDGVSTNIFPGSIQNYDVTLEFEDGSQSKVTIQATIEPSLPSLSITSIGGEQFSNDPGYWMNWGSDYSQPRVFDAQRITNPSDRPLMLWLHSNSTFTLRLGSVFKLNENMVLNADAYMSIHSVRINGQEREIGYQRIISQVIQPKETIEVQWLVRPVTADWASSAPNREFKRVSQIENFDSMYKPGYGALFGMESRAIHVSEMNYTPGQNGSKEIFKRVTSAGTSFWNSYPNGDVNYKSLQVFPGLVFTGR